MPNLNEIREEIKHIGSPFDVVRCRYIKELSEYIGRNVIIYYSGWLQKKIDGVSVNDADKDGFMAVIHKMDKSKGLDLILHTPGGDVAATESLVDYLHSMFGNNIRAIVPQLAMSAGTMIACACKEILMGQHSSLGPIDPQYNGIPAYGIVEEFQRAYKEIQTAAANHARNQQDPILFGEYQAKLAIWQPIIAKYNPTLIGECEKSLTWSSNMVKDWLSNNMFLEADEKSRSKIVDNIITELQNHSINKTHSRHLNIQKCIDIGLKIRRIEDDNTLQDLILSIHHSSIHTLTQTNAFKIIENQDGKALIQQVLVH